MRTSKFIAFALTATMLTACTQPNGAPNSGILNGGGLNKQDVGTGVGAVGGGVLGSMLGKGTGKIAATIIGAGLGGLIGNQVGKSLDNGDRAVAEQNAQKAMETAQPGQSMPWQGQNASGNVTPGNYTQNAQGQYCREYSQTIVINGQKQQSYGNACRQPDGSWQITN